MVKIKIGFSGPPCSGKTTIIHQLVNVLRRVDMRIDCLTGIERIPLYNIKNMTNIIEHNISLSNHILQESLHMRRPDIDILLIDRTPLDIYIDMIVSVKIPLTTKDASIWDCVAAYTNNWIKTYDLIYILPPQQFDNDGLRLNNKKWRSKIIKEYDKFDISDCPNIIRLKPKEPRDILHDICPRIMSAKKELKK